jgi:FixJ family two-component response regulator
MDIRMPALDGLEATRRLLAADKHTRVIIPTTFDLDEYVFEAIAAGASGFCSKTLGSADRRDTCRRGRRRAACPLDHPPPDRGIRTPPDAADEHRRTRRADTP